MSEDLLYIHVATCILALIFLCLLKLLKDKERFTQAERDVGLLKSTFDLKVNDYILLLLTSESSIIPLIL